MRTGQAQSKAGRNISFMLLTLLIVGTPAILTSALGYGFSPILTGSMEPKAQPGDLYITRLSPASTLRVGDIIAINNQITGTYYSHRIFEIRNVSGILRIITKGDANVDVDREPFMVSPATKVSKIISTVPYVGRPMVYLNTVQGKQAATSFLVTANILFLFAFLFRKQIVETFLPERVYKDLYVQERADNQQYRELIDNLQESLAIEKEVIEKVGNRS